MKKNKRLRFIVFLTILLLIFCVGFMAASWKSSAFSDWYTENIFPVLTTPYAMLTSLVPFSVGELMLTALLPILLGVVITALCKHFWKGFPLFVMIIATIMCLNCFVLYHCSPIKVSDTSAQDYNLEQLTVLRDYIVTQCNEMAEQIPHDEDGNVIYDGNMAEGAKEAVAALSATYPKLSGFTVTPKALLLSGFMSQQYMQGYYFPFSMEANYNDYMYIMNKPFTMCHEIAHTKGYIYEDEANFLGFLSCIRSDDIVFRYSGYLGVLNYVNNDFYKAVDKDVYNSHVKISDKVKYDNQFLTKEAWEMVEKRSIFKTETVKKAADTFVDTNLKVNGVSSGKVSYNHVVGLLLEYYYNGAGKGSF